MMDSRFLGHVFRSYGVATGTLYSAPTAEKLKGSQFYIIVSPDIPVKNPHPHYVRPEDAQQVALWVKQGGVLLLMAERSCQWGHRTFGLTWRISSAFISTRCSAIT